METFTGKVCSKCKVFTDDFANNKSKKDGKQSLCRPCIKFVNADYYKRTPEKNPARVASKTLAVARNRQYVIDYLNKHPCIDCGESDIVVLEFDHVRGEKKHNVSTLINHGGSIKTLQQEIDKCDVRCANDHRRVTAQRAGWFKYAPLTQLVE